MCSHRILTAVIFYTILIVPGRANDDRGAFRLPEVVPAPADNKPTPERLEL